MLDLKLVQQIAFNKSCYELVNLIQDDRKAYCNFILTGEMEGEDRMEQTRKELHLHTLRGDIQSCGMDGLSKYGIRQLLFARYVHDTETPVSKEEFDSVLDEEYQKVKAWRAKKGGQA